MINSIKEDLKNAKARILIRGWKQGGTADREGPACLLQSCESFRTATFLRSSFPDMLGGVAAWNDAEGRTVEEVLARIDAALELCNVDS